jgi:hypothetical protein
MKAFECRVLRKIYGPKRDEIAWGLEKMHNEESYDVHVSQNIQVMKSSRMRWVGHVARMGERKVAFEVLRYQQF